VPYIAPLVQFRLFSTGTKAPSRPRACIDFVDR
jgi:hypothetical protein